MRRSRVEYINEWPGWYGGRLDHWKRGIQETESLECWIESSTVYIAIFKEFRH